jgi:hypothetical protein
MAEGDDSFALNTLITILIATAIIICPPFVTYIVSWLSIHADDQTLIGNYIGESKDLTKYNTLTEMYLFSSYVPYKNVKGCSDKTGNKSYAEYISRASQIINNLNATAEKTDIKANAIKNEAEEKRYETKKEREKREQEDKVASEKEGGINSRHADEIRFKYLNLIVNTVTSGFSKFINNSWKFADLVIKITEVVVKTFGPILKALAANKVVMGFIILVFCIYWLLSLLKKDKAPQENANKIGGMPVLSGFSLSYIYDDIMDTYNHYKDMANSFSMSSYTGDLFKTEDGIEVEEEEDDTIIPRIKLDGGQYDNREYINIREIFGNEDVTGYFGNVPIEEGKYYNIYLPDERFKEAQPAYQKWKHVDAKNKNAGERVWALNCEEIDTIKNADGVDLKIPAFISVKDKCVINKSKLDAVYKSGAGGAGGARGVDNENVVFTTEYIRDE